MRAKNRACTSSSESFPQVALALRHPPHAHRLLLPIPSAPHKRPYQQALRFTRTHSARSHSPDQAPSRRHYRTSSIIITIRTCIITTCQDRRTRSRFLCHPLSSSILRRQWAWLKTGRETTTKCPLRKEHSQAKANPRLVMVRKPRPWAFRRCQALGRPTFLQMAEQ